LRGGRTTGIWKIQGVALDFHRAVFEKPSNLPRTLSATKLLDHQSSCHLESLSLFAFPFRLKSPITPDSNPFSSSPPPPGSMAHLLHTHSLTHTHFPPRYGQTSHWHTTCCSESPGAAWRDYCKLQKGCKILLVCH